MTEEAPYTLGDILAGIIASTADPGTAGTKIAGYFEQELLAHARHASASGCDQCTDLVNLYETISKEPDSAERTETLGHLSDQITSHMTLEDDLAKRP